MALTLSVLRCPDAVPPETRTVTGGEFSIGRGPDNQWTLADPDKFLSKRHCVLAFRSGGWQLADVSTNGTFLNRDSDPVGATPRDLRDGDRLRLGNYEIEIRIAEDAGAWRGATGAASGGAIGGGGHGGSMSGSGAFGDPFGDDPFAPPAPAPAPFGEPVGRQGFGDPPPMALPADFDPLGADFGSEFGAPTQPDHDSALEQAFRTPTPMPGPGLPADLDDWDLDLTPASAPPAAPPKAIPPQAAPPAPPPSAAAPAQVAPPPPPAAAPPALDVPDFEPPPFAASPPPSAQPSPVAGGEDAQADPFAEADVPSTPFAPAAPVSAVSPPVATPPVVPTPVAPSAAAPPPAMPVQGRAQPQPAGGDLMAAFLRGAGMEESRPADALGTMERLGAAFRAVVSGVRQTLIARATVKGEFRIEQTQIRARGNNPLKFSIGDDDALASLLGVGRRADMTPEAAIADALTDIRLHELATMAAMQSAVRALMERLDPAPLRAEGERAGGMLPAQKRARAFESFEKLHGEISRALADDFDSVFGKAFARAYEQALREATERDRSA